MRLSVGVHRAFAHATARRQQRHVSARDPDGSRPQARSAGQGKLACVLPWLSLLWVVMGSSLVAWADFACALEAKTLARGALCQRQGNIAAVFLDPYFANKNSFVAGFEWQWQRRQERRRIASRQRLAAKASRRSRSPSHRPYAHDCRGEGPAGARARAEPQIAPISGSLPLKLSAFAATLD
jgi:hypothetical protein